MQGFDGLVEREQATLDYSGVRFETDGHHVVFAIDLHRMPRVEEDDLVGIARFFFKGGEGLTQFFYRAINGGCNPPAQRLELLANDAGIVAWAPERCRMEVVGVAYDHCHPWALRRRAAPR